MTKASCLTRQAVNLALARIQYQPCLIHPLKFRIKHYEVRRRVTFILLLRKLPTQQQEHQSFESLDQDSAGATCTGSRLML
jgi:hypothetical protein